MKKQILFVIDSLNCGGAERSLVSLLPLLDYDKMEVDLLIASCGGIFERNLPQSVCIIELPMTNGLQRILRPLYRLWLATRVRFDRLFGLQCHGAERYWAVMNDVIAPLKKHYDVAVAYHQGIPTYYVATKVYADKKCVWINTDLQKAGYAESFNRPFYNKFDNIVTVSEALCKMLENTQYVDKNKLHIVYDILNPKVIKQMAVIGGFKDKLQINALRIVTVGRMTVPKNYVLAVKTAKQLRDAGLKFRWYFVGAGPERVTIENLVTDYGLEEYVLLLGIQSNPYPYMAGCDIYVQTSSFEGFCLTLHEARILNKPVICTNFSVVYNQIRDGENGLIAEMTSESVAEKIMLLAKNNALREKLIDATRLEEDRTMVTEAAKVNKMLLAQ